MNRTHRRHVARLVAGGLAVTGGGAVLQYLRRRRDGYRVFVLAYHDVSADAEEPDGTVSAQRFTKHVRFLKERFEVVSLADAVAMLSAAAPLRRDSVAITMDDGYLGNYDHAFPILRAERVPATVFVTTGFLDGGTLWFDLARRCFAEIARGVHVLPSDLERDLARVIGQWPPTPGGDAVNVMKCLPGAQRNALVERLARACAVDTPAARPLRWEQVREMSASGVEIGCHTVSHPILSRLPPDEQRREIVEARDRLDEIVGRPPRFFAYPNGSRRDFDEDTVRILRETGFEAAVTTVRGPNAPGCDLFRLNRVGVGADPNFLLAARFCGIFDDGSVARGTDTGDVTAPAPA